MGTVFGFSVPFDINVIHNYNTETVIFVFERSSESLEDRIDKELHRIRTYYPHYDVQIVKTKEVQPKRLGPPLIANHPKDFRTWVLEVKLYDMTHLIWCVEGDPKRVYPAMYPNFFHQPISVILNDLEDGKGPKETFAEWNAYVQANNNKNWIDPMRVEFRSQQLIC